MHIFRKGSDLIEFLNSSNGKIGFVPTMGALHDGHLKLVRHAKEQADIVVASVFVNPTQFNNAEDLEKYPRDEKGDASKLESVGCDVLWFPDVKELYPNGTESSHYELGELEEVMEGAFRPGHFQGVATVVDRLFTFVKPDVAVFGEKDYQQVAIIKKMVSLTQHKVEISVVATEREKSGLAMSSRNLRLTTDYKKRAPVIYEAMKMLKDHLPSDSFSTLVGMAEALILQGGLELEYLVIADENTLKPLAKSDDSEHPRVFVAAYAGSVRLIDNLSLN